MKMKKEKVKCSECEFCEEFRSYRRDTSDFRCKHPDQDYIYRYFMERRMVKSHGYLGTGKRYSHEVPVKTSPAWCPRKKAPEKGDSLHGAKEKA